MDFKKRILTEGNLYMPLTYKILNYTKKIGGFHKRITLAVYRVLPHLLTRQYINLEVLFKRKNKST